MPTKIAAYMFIGLAVLVALKACGARWIPKLWTDKASGEQDYMDPLIKWTPAKADKPEDHDILTDAVLETSAVGARFLGVHCSTFKSSVCAHSVYCTDIRATRAMGLGDYTCRFCVYCFGINVGLGGH